jgi:hypothetical protein
MDKLSIVKNVKRTDIANIISLYIKSAIIQFGLMSIFYYIHENQATGYR